MKLLKAEMKQSLTDVHDFLVNLKIPAPAEENPYPGDEDRLGIDGGLNMDANNNPSPEQVTEEPQETTYRIGSEDDAGAPPKTAASTQKETTCGKAVVSEPLQTGEAKALPASVVPEREEPRIPEVSKNSKAPEAAKGNATMEKAIAAPQVNLLANLVRWVSAARKEIGAEQLPTFLDVYSSTGNLSPELRKVILQLAGVVIDPVAESKASSRSQLLVEQLAAFLEVHNVGGQLSPELKDCILRFVNLIVGQTMETDTNAANIWSRLILELHGILAGGGTPLRPFGSSSEAQENEAKEDVAQPEGETPPTESHKEKPSNGSDNEQFKLKFVVPGGNGKKDREFYVV